MPFAKPGEGDNFVDEDVNSVCKSWGFVLESYWPGSSRTDSGLPGEDSVAPTSKNLSVKVNGKEIGCDALVVFVNPWRH